MKNHKIIKMLNAEELPKGFSYPESFKKILFSLSNFGGEINNGIEPWTIVADAEMDTIFSIDLGLLLVEFAQCWVEEMVAFFVVNTGPDPVVMVFDPWALKRISETKWIQTGKLLQTFPNFEAWLKWVRSSDLAKEYMEQWVQENSNNMPSSKYH